MSRQPSGKLKRLIILPFLLIMAASFSVSWSMYLIGSRESMRDLIRTVIREVADRVNETTRNKMQETLRIAEVNAAYFAEFKPGQTSADGIKRFFLSQLWVYDRLSIVSVGMDDGSYLEAQRLEDGRLRVASAGTQTGNTLVFRPVNADGSFGEPELVRPDYDPRQRPWYRSALDAGQPIWTEPYTLYSNSDPAMSASVPIHSNDGTVIGVTTAVLTLGEISEYLSQLPEASKGILYLVDYTGRLVASSAGAISIVDPDGQRQRARNHEDPLVALSAKAAGIEAPGEQAPVKNSLVDFSLNIGTVRYLGQARPFRTEAGLDWLVVTALRENAYTTKLAQMDAWTLAVLFAFLVAAVVAGWFIVESLTGPLRILVNDVDALVPGVPAPPGLSQITLRQNELGRLARSILALKVRLDENFGSIERSLREKDILLKEVHHRVKNNLQIVSSILSLQTGTIQDEQAREAFEECQDRIQAMALVHEEVYQTASFVELRMADYIHKICDTLRWSRAWGSATVDIFVEVEENAALPLDKAIPCGLVTNELVTNALKHAFRGKSHGIIAVNFSMVPVAMVDLSREPDSINPPPRFILVVADDGTGIAPDADECGGVGGQLVQGLVSQLKGTLQYDSAPDGGTSVRVEF
ncbi:MAG: histidine kinase dimerization/phosphoacceptor domain -containing protein [Spirochaetia bacterium]|jgi:two-component sensor histidine kinase|nr:histidine kinase dimerization/phosphoacceptor domain -containing protein [Spirochaetia bacterium]